MLRCPTREPLSSMKIDLHSHTRCSDGALLPEELFIRAHNLQIDMLAITDHDTVAAIDPIIELQKSCQRAMQIVPGIELSTSWHGFDIHIVGLHIDWRDLALGQRLSQQQAVRMDRAENIAHKLHVAGCDNLLPVVKEMAGPGQITRAHFAKALVKGGYAANFEQAFRIYLAKGKRAFVKSSWISVAQAIEWITQAGGVAVLAHPSRYDLSAKWLRRLIVEFKENGGAAMEVVYPGISSVIKNQMVKYTQEYDLYGSTGSDFHAPSQWRELGRNLALPEQVKPVWSLWC